jgi:hypothetical protein
MSNGEDQSSDGAKRAQFVAAPGPSPTEEQLSEMPSAQLPPPAPSGYNGPQDARLAELRAVHSAEFQNNPDLARKLLASMTWEVGDQSPDVQRGYVEGVLTRAARRKQSVDDTISSDHDQWYGTGDKRHQGYYDHRTITHLGDQFPADQLSSFQGVIHDAMQGSNISNYSTGNESDQLRNGTVAMTGTKNNRLVIEPIDQEWADGLTKSPPKAPLYRNPPQPPSWTPGTPLGSGPDIVNPTTQTDSDDDTGYAGPSLGGHLGAVNA